jgi:small subunit ribosomal protein S20
VPRTKSAKKAQRQTKARNERNTQQRSQLRTAIKKVRTAGSAEEAANAYAAAVSIIDRAGRKNLVHRNTANRTKSRLTKLVLAKAKTAK